MKMELKKEKKMPLSDAPVAYTFDDFQLCPVHSDVRSRKEPNVETVVAGNALHIPIISAPMNTVTESSMMVAMSNLGGASVLHRYLTIEDQVKEFSIAAMGGADLSNCYVAVGASGDYMERAVELYKAGVVSFCVDVANGHGVYAIEAVKSLRKRFPESRIMAGNTCSYDGTYRLAEAGADCIRLGVGGGAACTTREMTGHGIPQLSALEDSLRVKNSFPNCSIIADGGIKKPSDFIKAMAIGSDAVMIGSLLAATTESPGDVFEKDGVKHKFYFGMASEKGRASYFEQEQTSLVPEGISTSFPYKGSVVPVVENLVHYLKVGMSYSGAKNLSELKENAIWVRITQSGKIEGTPHGAK